MLFQNNISGVYIASALYVNIMQRTVGIFITLLTVAHAYIFSWIDIGTGATGAADVTNCPANAAEALMDNGARLSKCTEDQLRGFYRDNGCCYNFIAECNLIEREWWQKTDVLKPEPLCPYREKLLVMERRRLHKRFARRMRRVLKKKGV